MASPDHQARRDRPGDRPPGPADWARSVTDRYRRAAAAASTVRRHALRCSGLSPATSLDRPPRPVCLYDQHVRRIDTVDDARQRHQQRWPRISAVLAVTPGVLSVTNRRRDSLRCRRDCCSLPRRWQPITIDAARISRPRPHRSLTTNAGSDGVVATATVDHAAAATVASPGRAALIDAVQRPARPDRRSSPAGLPASTV